MKKNVLFGMTAAFGLAVLVLSEFGTSPASAQERNGLLKLEEV